MDDTAAVDAQEQPSDEDLWRAFVEGDEEALTALVERYRDELYSYLLLSTGQPRSALQHFLDIWCLVARYRREYEGFESFRSWLYAVATQNAVPATHGESFGLTDLLADIRRGEPQSRQARLFSCIRDLTRGVRQPFLLVAFVGLPLDEAAKACNFTRKRTLRRMEKACRMLARTGLFEPEGHADEV